MKTHKRALLREMRQTLREARKAMKLDAKHLKCALTGEQIKRVALAADGRCYDLAALRARRHVTCVLFCVEGKMRNEAR